MRKLLLATLLLPPIAAQAQTADVAADVAAGAQLARQWCSGCHQIAADAPARDAVPGFVSIARRPQTDAATLTAFLRRPHGQMPDFALSEANIRALTAYILSLR